jgi:predicted nucleic acid-binding protein
VRTCTNFWTHDEHEASFLRSLRTDRFTVVEPTDADLGRAAELVLTYADLPLGGTDGLVVAAAERLGLTTVATLDRRHFSVVRPLHADDSFELVP